MDMNGSEHIGAPVEAVWRALNDPEILRWSIPGCQALDKLSETELTATVVLKIGPLKATFQGSVELLNLNPPHAYTISGEGKSGIVGFAKGSADVSLVAAGPDATILSYTVRADVGGKIAQMKSRLIDSTARKLAGQFFTNFAGGRRVFAPNGLGGQRRRRDSCDLAMSEAAKSPPLTALP